LDWPVDTLNENLSLIQKKMSKTTKPVKYVVDLEVAVLGPAKTKWERFDFDFFVANHLYNAMDPYAEDDEKAVPFKASRPCGVAFRFVGARQVDAEGLPTALNHYDLMGPKDQGENVYSDPSGFSPGEMKLLDAVGPAPSGGILVVYMPNLGGGHGTAYHQFHVESNLGRLEEAGRLPKGRSREDLIRAWKDILLLADPADSETLAHEIGHILMRRGHATCLDEGPDCPYKGNLMLTGGTSGGSEGLLTENQCASIRGYASRLAKEK